MTILRKLFNHRNFEIFIVFVSFHTWDAFGSNNTTNNRTDLDMYVLKPIVVTAEKQTNLLQEVHLSLSVIDTQSINLGAIDSVEDLALQVPNFSVFSTAGRRSTFTFIRGVGAISVSTSPSIGYYVDDVSYLNSGMFNGPLYDVERIEVLRGPQGTLYGRNAISGVVNIINTKPKNETSGELGISLGSFGLQHYEVVANTELIDDILLLRVSGVNSVHDGYVTNDFTDNELQDRDELSGRLSAPLVTK